MCQKHDRYTQVLCVLGGRYLIELPMLPHDMGVQSFPVWIVFLLTGQWIQPSPSVLRSPFMNLSVSCFLHLGSRQYCQFWNSQSLSTCCRNMRRQCQSCPCPGNASCCRLSHRWNSQASFLQLTQCSLHVGWKGECPPCRHGPSWYMHS